MSPDFKPLLKWFGYSRRERRSTFILLIIIVLVIAVRYVVPEKMIMIEDISASLTAVSGPLRTDNETSGDAIKSFIYDSEKGSTEASGNQGLSSKRSITVKSVNGKGGRFRQPPAVSGNFRDDNNLSGNLSAYVGKEYNSAPDSGNGSVQTKMVDLNNCDSAMLDMLPGIGPILSVRIIRYRNLLGGFNATEQLKEVYGLSEETFARISPRVFADSTAVKQIDINVAGFKDLLKHPYLERYDIQAILKYRELNGRINSLAELTDNKILSPEKAVRIGPYLSFGKITE